MRRTVIGLAAAAVFVLAACGGDDDSGDENGGSDTTEASGGDASPSSPEAAQFCDQFMELTQQGPPGGSSPDAIAEALRGLDPPEDIADDFALTIEATELQAELAAGGAEPDPELQRQFQERESEYQDANMAIQEFLSSECQIGSPPPPDAGESGESGG